MKDQFEKNIKSLVEDFSYDYDPKAWEALSKQLPQAKSGFSWLGKLALPASLFMAAISRQAMRTESPFASVTIGYLYADKRCVQ